MSPSLSPWRSLLNHADDSSFLNVTGLTRNAFIELEKISFAEKLPKVGRPASIDDRDQLGLYLLFVGSRMELKYVCMLFGITPSAASRFINSMMYLVSKQLHIHTDAKVKFPSEVEMIQYASMARTRGPTVANVVGFVDALSIPVQRSDDVEEQNSAYNGYYHDTTVCVTMYSLLGLRERSFMVKLTIQVHGIIAQLHMIL